MILNGFVDYPYELIVLGIVAFTLLLSVHIFINM